MTYEDLLKDVEELIEYKKAYQEGKIEIDMSEDCLNDWVDKCNS